MQPFTLWDVVTDVILLAIVAQARTFPAVDQS